MVLMGFVNLHFQNTAMLASIPATLRLSGPAHRTMASRTLIPATEQVSLPASPHHSLISFLTVLYGCSVGNWQAPYYRTDSKGFRHTYQQEKHVDADYMNRSYGRKPYALAHSVAAFAHPKATANDLSQSRNVEGLKGLPGQPWSQALQTMKRGTTPPSDTQKFSQTAREARTAQMDEEARRRAEARQIFGAFLLSLDPSLCYRFLIVFR